MKLELSLQSLPAAGKKNLKTKSILKAWELKVQTVAKRENKTEFHTTAISMDGYI